MNFLAHAAAKQTRMGTVGDVLLGAVRWLGMVERGRFKQGEVLDIIGEARVVGARRSTKG